MEKDVLQWIKAIEKSFSIGVCPTHPPNKTQQRNTKKTKQMEALDQTFCFIWEGAYCPPPFNLRHFKGFGLLDIIYPCTNIQ